jgi:hypothetical protein
MLDEFAALVMGVGLLAEQLDAFGEIDDRGGSRRGVKIAGGERVEE